MEVLLEKQHLMLSNKDTLKDKILIQNINMCQLNSKWIFHHHKCYKEQQLILLVFLTKKFTFNQ